MTKVVLTDSCYWLGLLDPADQHHYRSLSIANLLKNHTLIFPWPCLYETVSTHLARSRNRTLLLEQFINEPGVTFLHDELYKTNALFQVFEYSRVMGYTFSLTDSVLREIIKDANVKIDYLVTFNHRDFHDVCAQRQIEIFEP